MFSGVQKTNVCSFIQDFGSFIEASLHRHVIWFICNFLCGLRAQQQILAHCHSCHGDKLCFVFIASIRLSDTERERDSFRNLLYPSFTCVSSSTSSVTGVHFLLRSALAEKYVFHNLQRSQSFHQASPDVASKSDFKPKPGPSCKTKSSPSNKPLTLWEKCMVWFFFPSAGWELVLCFPCCAAEASENLDGH